MSVFWLFSPSCYRIKRSITPIWYIFHFFLPIKWKKKKQAISIHLKFSENSANFFSSNCFHVIYNYKCKISGIFCTILNSRGVHFLNWSLSKNCNLQRRTKNCSTYGLINCTYSVEKISTIKILSTIYNW